MFPPSLSCHYPTSYIHTSPCWHGPPLVLTMLHTLTADYTVFLLFLQLYTMLQLTLVVNIAVLVVGIFRYIVVNANCVTCDPSPPPLENINATPLKSTSISICPSCDCPKSSQKLPVSLSEESKHTPYFQVPNIVHYIWFSDSSKPFMFHHMLSVQSAHKLINPSVILFHTDHTPVGKYWERVVKLPKFKVVKREPPTKLFGDDVRAPKFYTSHSNVDRLKVLTEYGGIYLDLDVLVTKPFDDLRRYVCTVGQEQETKACGSIIVCSNTSVFLYMWINSYLDDYRADEWAYNTGKVPFNLARRYPHMVNMEPTRLNHPNFNELDKIWGPATFDWQDNYAVHLWYRLWKDTSPYYHGIEPDEESVKKLNNTFGAMARTILYGSPQFIDSDHP